MAAHPKEVMSQTHHSSSSRIAGRLERAGLSPGHTHWLSQAELLAETAVHSYLLPGMRNPFCFVCGVRESRGWHVARHLLNNVSKVVC